MGNAFSEAAADLLQHRRPSAVLNHVVQQCSDREILVASRLQHQRSHTHQVRNVGNRGGLPSLPGMLLGSEKKRTQEARTKFDYLLIRERLHSSQATRGMAHPPRLIWLAFGGRSSPHCFSPR